MSISDVCSQHCNYVQRGVCESNVYPFTRYYTSIIGVLKVGVEMIILHSSRFASKVHLVGDVIFTPDDKISVQERTTVMWAATRGTHKIPKKRSKVTKEIQVGYSTGTRTPK